MRAQHGLLVAWFVSLAVASGVRLEGVKVQWLMQISKQPKEFFHPRSCKRNLPTSETATVEVLGARLGYIIHFVPVRPHANLRSLD